MKKFFLYILLVGVLGMLAVSCSDEFDSLGLDSNKTQVVFSIGMDSPIARSRAAWGEEYNPSDGGDAYDNRINPDQLYVKITHGGQIYDVKKILKWQDGKNLSSHTFVGEVDIDLKGQTKTMENARIEVFANWNPDAENGNVFSQGADYIPMWGVQTADITLAPGKREELQTIYLLRAMAKLQVCLTEEMASEYALKSVTLNKHNATGFCMPTLPTNGISDTKDLGLENVLNAKTSDEQVSLPLSVVQNGKDYVVYLPEIVNDGLTDEDLLKITVELAEMADGKATGNTEEGNFFIKDYADADNPKVIDIVRNHWYKYEIKGFAASEIQLNYAVLDWQEKSIEIGGDGFLFLNKDVIEIYNSNIDADQLKFSSSSPIKSIVLKDTYKHYRNGEIKETPVGETADEVYAYYMDKSGTLTQLADAVLLSNITANVKEEDQDVLSGGIVINSPFKANVDAEETTLQSDSHYNTIRYLEFEVENRQGLKATFRVMQYPPVVITNEEGFFSYRDDHITYDGGPVAHFLDIQGQHSLFITGIEPYHEHDWSNEVNQSAEWHALPVYQRNYSWVTPSCPADKHRHDWEELRYGMGKNPVTFTNSSGNTLSGSYSGGYRTIDGPASTDYFLRDRYHALPGVTESSVDNQGLAIGNPFVGEDGKTYRRHYTWDLQVVFWQKAVMEVLTEDKTYNIPVLQQGINICTTCTRNLSINKNPFRDYILASECKYPSSHKNKFSTSYTLKTGETTKTLSKGSAAIHVIAPNSTGSAWEKYSNMRWHIPVMNSAGTGYDIKYYGADPDPAPGYSNHRMYQIKSTLSNGQSVIGVPTIVDNNGNRLDFLNVDDAKIGITENSMSNANKVSPFLAVASELGETNYASVVRNAIANGYTVPDVKKLYAFAERHCREYVETTYNDKNNNYKRDPDEPVVHYHDWRLPTKAEIEMIISYQENSPAMDKLLTGQYYFCVTGNGNSDDISNFHNWVSSEVPNFRQNLTGYYIRCVRDVKPEGKNGTVEE